MDADFQATVRAHKDRLYALAVHLTGDRAEAEDVVQESFIKLWRQHPPPEPGAVPAWLLKVARNASLDRLRRRRLTALDDGAALDREAGPEPGPDRRRSDEEFRERLREALDALDEPHRSLVVMREVQGLEYAVIAEALSLSLTQVKVYLHRARCRLRHELKDFAHD